MIENNYFLSKIFHHTLIVSSVLTCLSSSKDIIEKKVFSEFSSSDFSKKNLVIPLYSNALLDILLPKLWYLSPGFFVENKKNESSDRA